MAKGAVFDFPFRAHQPPLIGGVGNLSRFKNCGARARVRNQQTDLAPATSFLNSLTLRSAHSFLVFRGESL